MKKIFTLCFLFTISFSFLGQKATYHFKETFDDENLPTGWTIDAHASNWSISRTNFAGGDAGELRLSDSPNFEGKTRIISPVIDLTGVVDLAITFNNYLNNFQGNHSIGIETTSDGGNTWNSAFQKLFGVSGHSIITEAINTADVGSSTFQFCLYYDGTSGYLDNWYFDNFTLFSRKNIDISLMSIHTVLYNSPNVDIEIPFTVINTGKILVNTLDVRYQFNNLPAVTETFTNLALGALSSKKLTFTQKANLGVGEYVLKVEVLKVNGGIDQDMSDNILENDFYVTNKSAERKVCIEGFSSSTCDPCVSTNERIKDLLAANEGKYTITKYQMNFPNIGDKYYTPDGGIRRVYYGINAVPHCRFNGIDSPIDQLAFGEALSEPAFIDLSGVYVMEGTNINISVKVESYLPVPEARLHVLVNEKKTTGNVGSNGETEFFHILMKMLPDGNGTTVSLATDQSRYFNFTYDMASTKVEEFDDLEVHVFLQNHSNQYIFNSNFLEEGSVIPGSPIALTAVQENTSVKLNWTGEGNPDSYVISFNDKVIAYVTDTDYTHENVPSGTHTYSVAAVIDGYASIPAETEIKISYIGIEDHVNNIKIYPNPANDYVYVEGENIQSIHIYNNSTQLIKSINNTSNVIMIDTKDFNSGIYHLRITEKSGKSFTQKLVITR